MFLTSQPSLSMYTDTTARIGELGVFEGVEEAQGLVRSPRR